MKDLTINVAPREETGTGPSSRLRREGRVPAVAYGKSKEPTQLSVDSRELAVALREIGNSTPLVKIKGGKGKAKCTNYCC